MISEIISEILYHLGNYLLGSPFSVSVHMKPLLIKPIISAENVFFQNRSSDLFLCLIDVPIVFTRRAAEVY